jgi:hypothetical protein
MRALARKLGFCAALILILAGMTAPQLCAADSHSTAWEPLGLSGGGAMYGPANNARPRWRVIPLFNLPWEPRILVKGESFHLYREEPVPLGLRRGSFFAAWSEVQ